MKKILSFILILCLCFCLMPPAFAADNTAGNDHSSDADYMAMVILNNSNVEVTPTDTYELIDVSGNQSYVCVEFDVSGGAKGFGIIDLSTYDVVMYALDAKIPFSSDDTIVYNGFLRFAVINKDSTATVLNSNLTVSQDALYDTFRTGLTLTTEETNTYKVRQKNSLSKRQNHLEISILNGIQ